VRKFAKTVLPVLIVLLGLSGMPSSAQATPITYTFTSQLPLGTTYGTGSFTFDSSFLGPLPVVITNGDLTLFSYSDPTAGFFTLADLASLNFTLGTTATTSGFAFIASNGVGSFIGGVVDANNVGGLSTDVGSGGVTNPYLRFPDAAITPEPGTASLCLIGFVLMIVMRKRIAQVLRLDTGAAGIGSPMSAYRTETSPSQFRRRGGMGTGIL
jgi:hypothetical protein